MEPLPDLYKKNKNLQNEATGNECLWSDMTAGRQMRESRLTICSDVAWRGHKQSVSRSQRRRLGGSKGFTRAGLVRPPQGEDYVGHKIDKTEGEKAVTTLSWQTSIAPL